MKVYKIQNNRLVIAEQDIPTPGAHQVLVRVRAAALNYRDLIVLRGNYAGQKADVIPMSDGAGEVVAVGEAVTTCRVGDRVAGTFFQTWTTGSITREVMHNDMGGGIDGMLAEYVVLEETGVVVLPEHLSYAEGATLPCAGLTAWHALVERGQLTAGESVLVLGTGGVSCFATQFAKHFGARVIATSSQNTKLEQINQLGVDETINYNKTPDWEKEVYRLTNKSGVNHVVEVGGVGTLEKSLKAVGYGGHIHLIGVLTGYEGKISPLPILLKSVTVHGIYVGNREMFERMNAAITQSQIHPLIDRRFSFEEAAIAYQYLAKGEHVGKVVIELA